MKTDFEVSLDFKNRTVTLGGRVFPFEHPGDSYGFGLEGNPFLTVERLGEVVAIKYSGGKK